MNTPLPLHILNLIGERLNNISKVNGYHFDIEKIKRERVSVFTGQELPIVFYWSESDARVEGRTGFETRQLPVFISAFFRTRDDVFADTSLEFGADIYTAIHRNPISPNVLDTVEMDLGCDNVEMLTVSDITPIIGVGEAPYAGVMVSLFVTYSLKNGEIYLKDCA